MNIKQNQDPLSVDVRNIIDAIPGHIYWCDQAGVILGCNQEQAQFFGYKNPSELVGKLLYNFYPERSAGMLKEATGKVIRDNQSITIEEHYTQPNGEEITYFSKKVPLRNAAAEIIGVIGIGLDISMSIGSEKEAQQDQIWILENIIGKMPGHVWWKDKNCRFMGCNDRQAKTAGLQVREDIRGKSAYDVITKDQPEKERLKQAELIDAIDRRIMKSGKGEIVEEPLVLPDGKVAIYLSHKEPLQDRRGNTIGLIGVSMDITSEKDRVSAENKAKISSILAAGIAHELRTPLAAIHLLAGQIQKIMGRLIEGYDLASYHDLISEPLSEKNKRIAMHAGARFLQIVRSAHMFIDMMLMKVNLDQPKGRPLTKLSACSSVEKALQTYPIDDDDYTLIHWDREACQNKDFVFMGDQTLFDHIIFNLLKNALHYVKFAPDGEIKIWIDSDSQYHFLHFMDTGTGISEAALPHIFDAFYTETTHGTGVGLALCKVIMHEFGGEIQCQSVKGEYTHFILKFPALNKELQA